MELLQKSHLPSEGLRSKRWDEFAVPGAPRLDFSFIVCDNTAGEICPVWPEHPKTAHWGVPDPAAAEGSDEDKRKTFAEAGRTLRNRIRALVSLRLERQDQLSLQRRLNELGRSAADAHVG